MAKKRIRDRPPRPELLQLTGEELRREAEFLRFVRRAQALADERGLMLSVFDAITEAHQMARVGRDWCNEQKEQDDALNFESTWGLRHHIEWDGNF